MKYAVAAQWADLVTFVGMYALLGSSAEANPLVRAALAGGLFVPVIAAKVAVMVTLAAWRSAVGRGARSVGLAGVVMGVIGTAANLRALA